VICITTTPRGSTWASVQHDVSVIWDLAPHDLSIMDFLIHQKPQAVVATR